MKKFILTFISIIALALVASAQFSTPSFGLPPFGDNTGRALVYKLVTVVDATGNDSVKLAPNAFQTIVTIAAKDSITLSAPNVTTSHLGDRITIIINSTTGTPKVKFSAYLSLWKTSGTATLSAGYVGTISLIFNGVKWVETDRLLF
jgi:hypothetical protein